MNANQDNNESDRHEFDSQPSSIAAELLRSLPDFQPDREPELIEIGGLLRDAATNNLPTSNRQLRDDLNQWMDESGGQGQDSGSTDRPESLADDDGQLTESVVRPAGSATDLRSTRRFSTRHYWQFAAAGLLLVLVGLAYSFGGFKAERLPVAVGAADAVIQAEADLSGELAATAPEGGALTASSDSDEVSGASGSTSGAEESLLPAPTKQPKPEQLQRQRGRLNQLQRSEQEKFQGIPRGLVDSVPAAGGQAFQANGYSLKSNQRKAPGSIGVEFNNGRSSGDDDRSGSGGLGGGGLSGGGLGGGGGGRSRRGAMGSGDGSGDGFGRGPVQSGGQGRPASSLGTSNPARKIEFGSRISDRLSLDDAPTLGFSRDRFDGQQSNELNELGGEQYNPIYENPFVPAIGKQAVSTFSIDVDTAAYANIRRFLNAGQLPPPNSVRLEEMINYFSYDYAQPSDEHPFSVHTELAECPWQTGHQLLRIGLKGKEVHVQERPASNLVFLIDVSGSMNSADKLSLLKTGFQLLTKQLGETDRVTIVTYAGQAGVALPPTNGSQTSAIESAIEKLTSGGSTHGSAGIELAYQLAQQNFIADGVNKVILATDGDLNVGVTDDQQLVRLIKNKAAEGVFLTVLGFGTGNLKDGKLEQLADNGNGMYAYVDSIREAKRLLVDQLSGSLVTIAKDVKIQVEFNPAEVKSYRLLGYENRLLAARDFNDDRKDAGEIGAGHTVTAIYQIQPARRSAAVKSDVPLKYQPAATPESVPVIDSDRLATAAGSGELGTVALRYKQPTANQSVRLEVPVKSEAVGFPTASDDFRFAASVAEFGMQLRNSGDRGQENIDRLIKTVSNALGNDRSGYRAEFLDLLRRYQSLR